MLTSNIRMGGNCDFKDCGRVVGAILASSSISETADLLGFTHVLVHIIKWLISAFYYFNIILTLTPWSSICRVMCCLRKVFNKSNNFLLYLTMKLMKLCSIFASLHEALWGSLRAFLKIPKSAKLLSASVNFEMKTTLWLYFCLRKKNETGHLFEKIFQIILEFLNNYMYVFFYLKKIFIIKIVIVFRYINM